MVKQNKINEIVWEIIFSLEKNGLFLCAVYLFRKENIPLSSPGNLRLISVYNEKIISVILSTAMETAV